MIEAFRFTTTGRDPDSAVRAYRELYSIGADVLDNTEAFSADITAHRLDRLILFSRRLRGVGHARPPQRVVDNKFSHFVAHMVVEGELLGAEDSRFTRAGPGDIVLQDLRLPSQNRIPDGHIITVSVARDLVEAAAGTSNGLHGRLLPPERSGLLGDHLLSISRRVDDLAYDALPTLNRTFVSLLGLAVAPTGAGPTASRRLGELERRAAAQRVIERALTDPALDAAYIIRETGISRATLYRLLKPYGGVDHFINDRRLTAVRVTLTNRSDITPLAELASRYCFRDEADLRTRFRDRFGMTPTAFRQMIDDPAREIEAIKRRWESWMIEVR